MKSADTAKSKIVPFKKKNKGPVTVIDIDGEVLRVAEASGNESTRVESCGITSLPGSHTTPEQIGSALKKALTTLKVRGKSAIFAVPRNQVVLRPIAVPNVAEIGELSSIVYFQIAKDLPFRLEDAAVDFKVLRVIPAQPSEQRESVDGEEKPAENPAGQLEVLVGAVKAEIVEHYRKVAHAAGLKLTGLGLPASGGLKALQTLGLNKAEEATVLVTLRNEASTIDIFAHNTIAVSRVANEAATETGNAEKLNDKAINNLGTEVLRTLNTFEAMLWHQPIGRILVAGSTGREEKLLEVLRTRLPFPAETVALAPLLPSNAEADSGALPVLGLALAASDPSGLPIDFAHPKKPAAPRNTRRTRMLLGAVALVLVLFTLLGVRAQLVKKRVAIRNSVQMQLTDAEKKLPIYRKLKAQTKVVKSWTEEEQNWLNHLAYISGILPGADQLYVSSIATTSQRVIRMSVQAKTGELLAELDKKLRLAGYEVKPLSITPANDKYGYNFRTTVELAVSKKLKIDLQKIAPPKRPEDDVSKSASAPRPTGGGLAR